jgi:tripartite-type tricarboxylate transporter receptor subunit TctC
MRTFRAARILKLVRYHDETSPPKFSASGSGRCRACDFVVYSIGTRLSDAAGAFDCRLPCRRPYRHPGSQRLGQQFIVEDQPGAGTNLATETVLRAPPDGYTFLMATSTNAINATLYDHLKFNFIRDTTPAASIARTPLVIVVNPSFPAKSVPDFITYAKANPGKINMATAGIGSSVHLAGELFMTMTGVQLVPVHYRNSYVPDMLAGQVQLVFSPIPTTIEQVRAGKLRALAVTSGTRSQALPDVPTIGEFVSGYEASVWNGVVAPKNTPAEIIDKLYKEIDAALADPKIMARFAQVGSVPKSMTPADFGKFIAADTEKWGKVIRAANIKAE